MTKRDAEDLFDALPRSRSEAKAEGASHYFTGAPCKNGHVDKRTTSQAKCAECVRARQRARLEDPEFRARHNQWALERVRRKSADPAFLRNRRKIDERTRRKPEVRERKRVADRKRHARPEVKARQKRWADLSPRQRAMALARAANRRDRIRRGTPARLGREHRREIVRLYDTAAAKKEATGVEHHVDHVIPLRGRAVSGLHVPWNMQVVPAEINQRKYNTVDEETIYERYAP